MGNVLIGTEIIPLDQNIIRITFNDITFEHIGSCFGKSGDVNGSVAVIVDVFIIVEGEVVVSGEMDHIGILHQNIMKHRGGSRIPDTVSGRHLHACLVDVVVEDKEDLTILLLYIVVVVQNAVQPIYLVLIQLFRLFGAVGLIRILLRTDTEEYEQIVTVSHGIIHLVIFASGRFFRITNNNLENVVGSGGIGEVGEGSLYVGKSLLGGCIRLQVPSKNIMVAQSNPNGKSIFVCSVKIGVDLVLCGGTVFGNVTADHHKGCLSTLIQIHSSLKSSRSLIRTEVGIGHQAKNVLGSRSLHLTGSSDLIGGNGSAFEGKPKMGSSFGNHNTVGNLIGHNTLCGIGQLQVAGGSLSECQVGIALQKAILGAPVETVGSVDSVREIGNRNRTFRATYQIGCKVVFNLGQSQNSAVDNRVIVLTIGESNGNLVRAVCGSGSLAHLQNAGSNGKATSEGFLHRIRNLFLRHGIINIQIFQYSDQIRFHVISGRSGNRIRFKDLEHGIIAILGNPSIRSRGQIPVNKGHTGNCGKNFLYLREVCIGSITTDKFYCIRIVNQAVSQCKAVHDRGNIPVRSTVRAGVGDNSTDRTVLRTAGSGLQSRDLTHVHAIHNTDFGILAFILTDNTAHRNIAVSGTTVVCIEIGSVKAVLDQSAFRSTGNTEDTAHTGLTGAIPLEGTGKNGYIFDFNAILIGITANNTYCGIGGGAKTVVINILERNILHLSTGQQNIEQAPSVGMCQGINTIGGTRMHTDDHMSLTIEGSAEARASANTGPVGAVCHVDIRHQDVVSIQGICGIHTDLTKLFLVVDLNRLIGIRIGIRIGVRGRSSAGGGSNGKVCKQLEHGIFAVLANPHIALIYGGQALIGGGKQGVFSGNESNGRLISRKMRGERRLGVIAQESCNCKGVDHGASLSQFSFQRSAGAGERNNVTDRTAVVSVSAHGSGDGADVQTVLYGKILAVGKADNPRCTCIAVTRGVGEGRNDGSAVVAVLNGSAVRVTVAAAENAAHAVLTLIGCRKQAGKNDYVGNLPIGILGVARDGTQSQIGAARNVDVDANILKQQVGNRGVFSKIGEQAVAMGHRIGNFFRGFDASDEQIGNYVAVSVKGSGKAIFVVGADGNPFLVAEVNVSNQLIISV